MALTAGPLTQTLRDRPPQYANIGIVNADGSICATASTTNRSRRTGPILGSAVNPRLASGYTGELWPRFVPVWLCL
jgi:hypothetical protein